jgi:hypothetical protein
MSANPIRGNLAAKPKPKPASQQECGVVLAHGEEFDVVHGLAFDFFKAVEGASGIATDGGLAALGDDGFGQPPDIDRN